jgi:DNA-binding IclR family transcriptional regulator
VRGTGSAPTERVLDIVELLSRPGRDPMRFSDIARELELTQGTAHAILKTLSDRGWVTRDPTGKSFTLGPTVALIAANLSTARPLAHLAREAVGRLVAALEIPASVIEVAGDELMITTFESPAHSSVSAAANERIPYRPPFGVAYAAWDTPDGQQGWIARGAVGDRELERRLRDVLTRTRERGYDVDWMTPALAQAAHAIGTLSVDAVPAAMRPVIDQLRAEFASAGIVAEDAGGEERTVATISAPVLDAAGHVTLIIGVHPLRPMTTRDITVTATSLLAEIAALAG